MNIKCTRLDDRIDRIVKHSVVSRATALPAEATPGVAALCRLRLFLRDIKRGRRNAREDFEDALRCEARHGPGAAYEAGYAVAMPNFPDRTWLARRIQEALSLGGLPRDLEQQCNAWLTEQP